MYDLIPLASKDKTNCDEAWGASFGSGINILIEKLRIYCVDDVSMRLKPFIKGEIPLDKMLKHLCLHC